MRRPSSLKLPKLELTGELKGRIIPWSNILLTSCRHYFLYTNVRISICFDKNWFNIVVRSLYWNISKKLRQNFLIIFSLSDLNDLIWGYLEKQLFSISFFSIIVILIKRYQRKVLIYGSKINWSRFHIWVNYFCKNFIRTLNFYSRVMNSDYFLSW